nr:Ty3/gypsy retrotransposon protein [Tanacetum cinerariifolium]
KTIEEHKEHMLIILSCLREHTLYENRKKCFFAQPTIEYLGHVVSRGGVSADPLKVSAILEWSVLKNLKALRGFLSLTGYYRDFVQGYDKIACANSTTKKDNINWNEEATNPFNALKLAMSSIPVLALLNLSKEFVVDTDALGFGIGAVLMQEGRPIAYYSQTLGSRAIMKSVYQQELMAILLAIQKWRPYLLGRRFIVRTDQRSLNIKPITKTRGLMPLLGEKTFQPVWLCRFQGLSIGKICLRIWGTARYYPEPQMDSRIFDEFYSGAIEGHAGILKTYKQMAAELYWVGMKQDVTKLVSECEIFQRNKYSNMVPGGLLQPLALPDKVWDEFSMDFIEGLPKSDGFATILVVVDRLSKYSHFIPLRHPYTASIVAAAFLREIVRLHGIPIAIVSDRDKIFLSNFWKELFRLQGTNLRYSTAYYPHTNGQTEVVKKRTETYLRCFTSKKPKKVVQVALVG